MKYRIYHFFLNNLDQIPGIYVNGSDEYGTKYFIDIPDELFAEKIRQLAKEYDVMLRDEDGFIITLDYKGGRFRQR